MSCALGMVRWLIFLVNFIFALGGLILGIFGIALHFNLSGSGDLPEMEVLSYPTTLLIVVGFGVFIIAFFGCCGAVQENHCMIVTFALMLLALLVIQVATATYGFIKLKDQDLKSKINTKLEDLVTHYYEKGEASKKTVDTLQIFASCCGYNGYLDYKQTDIPYSCCGKPEKEKCTVAEVMHTSGCKDTLFNKLESYGKGLGIGAFVVAAAELFGVIFALCLANSIRNAERRGYKV